MSDRETAPVAVTILELERLTAGQIVALANVELDIGGIVIVLQGVQVVREQDGFIRVKSPQHRTASGFWRPAAILPVELQTAIGRGIEEAMRASAPSP